MDRPSLLSGIIRLEPQLRDVAASLAELSWDAEPVVTLNRMDITRVLDRYSRGEIDAATVEEWANIIECGEDIQLESGSEAIILQAIYDLANPALQGELSLIVQDVCRRMR